MSRDTQALLEAFDHLPAEEKRAFTEEVLRRSLPFDSGPLADEEIVSDLATPWPRGFGFGHLKRTPLPDVTPLKD